MSNSDLVRTGITGLDDIFLGGIPRGNVILVEGEAGAGKSLLGTEFIYRGIVEYDEPGIIVVFENSPQKLMRDVANFGWNLEELQQQNRLRIIFTTPQVLEQELRSADSLLIETATELGARRIFIDGIALLRPTAANAGSPPSNGPSSYRELLQQIIEGIDQEGLSAIFSHELATRIGAERETIGSLTPAGMETGISTTSCGSKNFADVREVAEDVGQHLY